MTETMQPPIKNSHHANYISSFKEQQKQVVRAARDLGYPREAINAIKKCKTVSAMSRIMVDCRNGKFNAKNYI